MVITRGPTCCFALTGGQGLAHPGDSGAHDAGVEGKLVAEVLGLGPAQISMTRTSLALGLVRPRACQGEQHGASEEDHKVNLCVGACRHTAHRHRAGRQGDQRS